MRGFRKRRRNPLMEWYPHLTVATVIENDGRFLLVEEWSGGELVFNQPAGHLEPDESLAEAARREALEETGWTIELQGVVGFGLYTAPGNGVTYHRTTFFGRPLAHDAQRPLDTGIERAVWLTLEEIERLAPRMRSPLVPKVIHQYLDGHRYPLSMILD
jgi:8-oxo-dGTP pyrophosphatase MutT (NUDIX family)